MKREQEENSMNSFIYDIPTKVYFGENQLGHLGEELSRYGKRYCSPMEAVRLKNPDSTTR